MTINISFGGTQISRPGAYAVTDSSNMTPVQVGSFKTLAVVGNAPNLNATIVTDTTKVRYYTDPTVATTELGAGDLIDNMKIMWKHGANLIAVSLVIGTGTAGAVQDADWDTALGRLTSEDVDGIVPITTAGAIQVKVDAHVTTMSSVTNKMERRGFYGHVAGLATTDVVALQTAISDERAMLATPAVKDYDATGAIVVKDSVRLASAYAGIWAGQNPEEPITYKYVQFPGLEKRYSASDITTLLNGHIAPTEFVQNKGLRIVQGVTCSASADLTQGELSVSTLKDVMNQNIRSFFEDKYVGKAGVQGIAVTMYNDGISLLEGFKKDNWISGYVQDTVKITQNGTAFSFEWEGSPTLPINNFLSTSHFTL